jgi:hypothetical protein
MESKPEKCAHPSCACPAKQGSKYCSTYCEGEAKTVDIICSCGHPGCSPSKGLIATIARQSAATDATVVSGIRCPRTVHPKSMNSSAAHSTAATPKL